MLIFEDETGQAGIARINGALSNAMRLHPIQVRKQLAACLIPGISKQQTTRPDKVMRLKKPRAA